MILTIKACFYATFAMACGAAILVVTMAADAQNLPWRLAYFGQAALAESSDKVSSAQQILRNDQLLKSGRCDFAQIPLNSTARFSGFHENAEVFIFPTFQVRYATTGQRMYAADGVFLSSAWRVSMRLRECRSSALGDTCLAPRTCQALDGLIAPGPTPSYVAVPSRCRVSRTQQLSTDS